MASAPTISDCATQQALRQGCLSPEDGRCLTFTHLPRVGEETCWRCQNVEGVKEQLARANEQRGGPPAPPAALPEFPACEYGGEPRETRDMGCKRLVRFCERDSEDKPLCECGQCGGVAGQLPLVLILTHGGHREPQTERVEAYLAASGYRWAYRPLASVPDGGVQEWMTQNAERPIAALRWDEHGGTWGESGHWRQVTAWCYEHGISPIYIDFAYYDHYQGYAFYYGAPDGRPSLYRQWDSLPDTIDWDAVNGRAGEYVQRVRQLYREQADASPLVDAPYIAAFIQATAPRGKWYVKSAKEWVDRVYEMFSGRVVFKDSPVADIEFPPGAKVFRHDRYDQHIVNANLAAHAEFCLIHSSSVSNEFVIAGLPVVATGRGFFHELSVFDEPQSWDEVATWEPRPINDTARAKFANWWLARQAMHGERSASLADAIRQAQQQPEFNGEPQRSPAPVKQEVRPIQLQRFMLDDAGFLGDAIAATAAVRDIKRAYPDVRLGVFTRFPEVFQDNPHLNAVVKIRGLTASKEEALAQSGWTHLRTPRASWRWDTGHTPRRNQIDQRGWHDADPNRSNYWLNVLHQFNMQTGLRVTRYDRRPEVFLTDAERTDRPLAEPYWIVCSGGKANTEAKNPPTDLVQAVVDQTPGVRWVQLGNPGDHPLLTGTEDHRAAMSVRDLFRWVYHASGVLCNVGAFMHIAQAVDVPCVVLAGGRETPMWAQYPDQAFFHSVGQLDCCRLSGCWGTKCEHKPNRECYRLIDPADVAQAVLWRDQYGYQSSREAQHIAPDFERRWDWVSHHLGFVGQRKSELACVLEWLQQYRPIRRVLEVGCARGAWAAMVGVVAEPHAVLLGVDAESSAESERDRQSVAQLLSDTRGQRFEWLVGDSAVLFDRVRQRMPVVDLLHIDADHDYPACRQDFERYVSLVRPGGVAILHDSGRASGVQRFVAELEGEICEPGGHKTIRFLTRWQDGNRGMGTAALVLKGDT